MAESRGQSATGPSPFEGLPGNPGAPAAGPGHVPAVKIDMGPGPPPARRAPQPARAGTGAMILIPSLLSLILGGAGAWAYERYAPRPDVKTPADPVRSPATDSRTHEAIGLLTDRVSGLEEEYKHLDARLKSLPKPPAAANLQSLERKAARVDELSARVEAIGRTLDPLPHQIEQLGQKLAGLDARLEERERGETSSEVRETTPPPRVRQTVATRPNSPERDQLAAPEHDDPINHSQPASNADPKGEAGEATAGPANLDEGIRRFRGQHYAEAYDVFRQLMMSRSDDARVWYFAALSYGLAARDWGPMTEMMAREGVRREKAGKPARAVIDQSLAGLTRQTGKEWLEFFRERAK